MFLGLGFKTKLSDDGVTRLVPSTEAGPGPERATMLRSWLELSAYVSYLEQQG